jgi:ser/thr/tyr protein kinase RAD53
LHEESKDQCEGSMKREPFLFGTP